MHLAQAGGWDEAREALAAVLAAEPNALAARRALAHCHLRLGDAHAALETARHPSLLDD